MEIYRFTLTHNTKLYYLQFIREIINTSKLTIFQAVFGEMSDEDCWLQQSDASDGME